MENALQKPITLKSLFEKEDVQKKFQQMLGKKSQGFITSVLQIAASNDMLAKADPMSILNAAAVAATLDLPLNNSCCLQDGESTEYQVLIVIGII
jgi:recombination protein RecT